MHPDARILEALAKLGDDRRIVRGRRLSGGEAQAVWWIELDDGTRRVAKTTPSSHAERLRSEADGLRALARAGHLLVPGVEELIELDTCAVLVMDAFDHGNASETSWRAFGRALAEHHLATDADQYGWTRDNFIGATPQINTRCDDWVRFNAEHRLGFQVRLAHCRHRLGSRGHELMQRVIDRLDSFIPRRPQPTLLHGDLWSGNALATMIDAKPSIAVIDPAVSIGDAWADIAMMRMFGEFPQCCFDAYAEVNLDQDLLEQRILVYQLYHTLNHLNLFGAGYLGSCVRIAQSLLAML